MTLELLVWSKKRAEKRRRVFLSDGDHVMPLIYRTNPIGTIEDDGTLELSLRIDCPDGLGDDDDDDDTAVIMDALEDVEICMGKAEWEALKAYVDSTFAGDT